MLILEFSIDKNIFNIAKDNQYIPKDIVLSQTGQFVLKSGILFGTIVSFLDFAIGYVSW